MANEGVEGLFGRGLAPTFLFERGGRAVDAEPLVRPLVEEAGLELVEVGMAREAGRRVLRVVVDRNGGVDLDTIAGLSERVSRRLDLEGFAPGPYSLEVSSPGIERPLSTPDQYRRAVGRRVRVKTVAPVEGARNHVGQLLAADEKAILVATTGGEIRLRHADVASARTEADWSAELKRSTR
jgi:ribosome maturation factor RimP